jgi:hypothetical protein
MLFLYVCVVCAPCGKVDRSWRERRMKATWKLKPKSVQEAPPTVLVSVKSTD